MRYFFHIVGGSERFPDELGRSLLTLESAKRHAKILADELRKGDDFCRSSLVRVVDEHGNYSLRMPRLMSGSQPSKKEPAASRAVLY